MSVLFPAIDLRDGGVVRLFQGDYARTKRYERTPAEVARSFEEAGASFLHVVDLDGALDGTLANFETVRGIVEATGLFVEIGGGIRDRERIARYLDAGVGRVILGTAAVRDPEFLDAALAEFGPEKIVVGVDMRDGRVAVQGWTEDSGLDGMDFCRELAGRGVKTLICTDIAKDGAMAGTNRELYRELVKIPGLDIVASGGVSTLEDVWALVEADVAAIIIGKALYEGAFSLADALAITGERTGR